MRALKLLFVIFLVTGSWFLVTSPVHATTAGPNSPGTATDDATVGSMAWADPTYVFADDSNYAIAGPNAGSSVLIYDYVIKLIKSDGTLSSTNASAGVKWLSTMEAYYSYGGASSKWGETWAPSNINSANFGVVLECQYNVMGEPAYSHYLDATNFGFSIPTGATIDGILVEIKKLQSGRKANANHIRITVSYTGGAAPANTSQVIVITTE